VSLSRASGDSEYDEDGYDEDGYDRDGCGKDEYAEDEQPERIGFPACNLITFKEIVVEGKMVRAKRFFPESFALRCPRLPVEE